MLETVEVRNTSGELLTLSMEDVSNGLYIGEIRGLGPVKATLVSSSFASADGTQFQSARREARNIVFKIYLEPDYTTDSVRDLRARLYPFFMTKAPISLRFIDDEGLEVDISGRVETFETSLFDQEPVVDISVMCFDPDFVDETEIVLEGDTVSTTTETLVEYPGTVESGMVIQLLVDRTLTEFTVYHRGPDNVTKQLDISASLVADDVVTISTVGGDKYIKLVRAAAESSLLYAKSPQSPWLEFTQGDNHIRVYATGAAIPYTITYKHRYGGL